MLNFIKYFSRYYWSWSGDFSSVFLMVKRLITFLNKYLFWERGAERESQQALSCQCRARRGARTHELWDHDLSQRGTLNRLSPPSSPSFLCSYLSVSLEVKSSWAPEMGVEGVGVLYAPPGTSAVLSWSSVSRQGIPALLLCSVQLAFGSSHRCPFCTSSLLPASPGGLSDRTQDAQLNSNFSK